MLTNLRRYQQTIGRAVIVLFLLTGNVSAWAANVINQSEHGKSHCSEHTVTQEGSSVTHHDKSAKQQHDCCKTKQTCNKSCCNFCVMSGAASLALFSSFTLPDALQGTEYIPSMIILPDGVMSSTPYRPPQALLS